MDIQTHLLTNEAFRDFETQPENIDKHYELYEGMPSEMPSPSPVHNFIVARVVYFLVAYLLTHDIGYAFGDNTDFDLAPGIIYKPDAAFVLKSRVPQLPKVFTAAPEIAVEVISPANTVSEIAKKVETFLRYGSQRVWVIYPEERAVRVYRAAEAGAVIFYRLTDSDTLNGEDVLPGLNIPISALFPAHESESVA